MAKPAQTMSRVDAFDAFGERLAVVGPDGTEISYRGLGERVEDMQARLGATRRLVLVAACNDVDSLVTYLAATGAGHPVLLASAQDERRVAALVDAYDPDVLVSRVGGSWLVDERRAHPRHALHPDLALMLSTSGSTGSPKLVRLSAANLAANAAAIADYLDIRDSDRAAVSLPLHYCYGLSLVNSNLLRGAALLLSDRSVTEPQFWTTFREHGGTSLHGVPYTFELLDQVGFPDMRLPDLRYVTQAGGRLAPHVVRRYAQLGERRGWQLFVMYGQTEATARMAYLPPALAAAHPSAIGVPIAGGSFEIDGSGDRDEGDLIFRGPGVMLGYAENRTDLAAGRTVDHLRTGDIARRRADGLYEIVGRSSRFIKPFGLRIDLDHVERILDDEGIPAACTGTDEELVVAAVRPATDRIRGLLADRLMVPSGRIRVVPVPELPRGENGKIDYPAVEALARRPDVRVPSRLRIARPPQHRSVYDAFATVFPGEKLRPDATFAGLGGDSLTYVQMTVALQSHVGELPPDWPVTPIEQLCRLEPRRRYWPLLETGVVLRAVAIVLVVGTHIGLFDVVGGAHLLLGIAGWAFARFVLTDRATTTPSRAIVRSAARTAVPTALWISWRALVESDVHLHNALLINSVVDPHAWGYWFVETLVQTLLILAVIFAIPAVRRLERAHPFGFAVAVMVCALPGRLFTDAGNEFSDRVMSTHLVLWLFALGWVVHRATTLNRRVLAAALVVLLVPGFFADPVRNLVVTAGLLLLLLVAGIPLPRIAHRPVGAVAAASLAIYLTHYAVYPELLIRHVPAGPAVLACLAVGLGAQYCVTTAVRTGRVAWRSRSTRIRDMATTGSCPPATEHVTRASRPVPRPGRAGPGDAGWVVDHDPMPQ